jgi:hypothetical protein
MTKTLLTMRQSSANFSGNVVNQDLWDARKSLEKKEGRVPRSLFFARPRVLAVSTRLLVAQPVFLANEAVNRLRPEMLCRRILEYQRDVRELHVWRACSSRNTDLQL